MNSLRILLGTLALIFTLYSISEGASPGKQWEQVVAAANKEGKVVIYAAGSGISKQHLITFKNRFETAFPGIQVSYLGGRSSEMFSRLMAERRAGKFIPDLYLGSGSSRTWADRTVTQRIRPTLLLPEVLDMSKWLGGKFWFYDKEERYSLIYSMAAVTIIAINTKLVKPNEITSYKDLLDPKWRGQIVSRDLRGGGTGSSNIKFLYLHPDLGPSFLTKLYTEMDVTLSRSSQQMIDWLARGRYAIHLFPRKFDLDRAKSQGLPVDLLNPLKMKEGSALTAGSRGVQLLNPAPHPNAAKVYVNWLLSVEGQEGLEKFLGYPSLRSDTQTKGAVREFIVPQQTTELLVVSLGKYDHLDKVIRKLLVSLIAKRGQ
ncbi:MAG: extracellular solute-binding protein [Nitrososphaerales archaeon]